MKGVEEKTIKNDIFNRFSESIKFKLNVYQLTVLLYYDHILALFSRKHLIGRGTVLEKNSTLKQNDLKSEVLSKYKNCEEPQLNSFEIFKTKFLNIFGIKQI